MNKANVRFKKIIEDKLRELTSKIKKDYLTKINCGIYANPIQVVEIDENLKKECKQLEEISDTYKEESYCTDFDFVQEYLDLYHFTKEEQADILCYLLNVMIKILKLMAKEYSLNDTEKVIKRYIEKEKADITVNEMIDYHCNYINICDQLSILISEDGVLKPLPEASILKNALLSLLLLTEEQVNLITSVSESRAKAKTLASLERYYEIMNKINLERPDKRKEDDIKTNIKTSKKELGIAKRDLKQYLINDKPIKFINEEEFVVVINLLKMLGYTENSINIIRKNILLNNQSILDEIQNSKLKTAIENYLSESDKTLLEHINSLLVNNDSIKNTLYDEISEWYSTINSLLLNLDSDKVSFKDDYDYLLLCLEELNSLFVAYKNSNYKLVLSTDSN